MDVPVGFAGLVGFRGPLWLALWDLEAHCGSIFQA